MLEKIICEGFKEIEMHVIPTDWDIKKIEEVFEFFDEKRKPIKRNIREKMNGEYPYYGASGIIDYVDDFIFNDELILLGEDGENIISRNTRLAFKISGKCWINNHAHVLKPRNGYNITFLAELLESLNYEKYNSGTAQPKLNKQTCSKIQLIIPPYTEQQKIASALSSIDDLINQLEHLIKKKKNIKQGTMQELLTGKRRLDGFSEVWVTKKLEEVGDIFSGTSAPQEEQYFVNGLLPFVRVSDLAVTKRTKNLIKVRDYVNKNCIIKKSLVKAKKGTVIFPKSGASVGNNNRAQLGIDMYLVSHLAGIFCEKNSNDFIYYLLCMIDMLDYVGDKNYPSLKISKIKNILIKLPKDKEEQEAISQIIFGIDNDIEESEKMLDKFMMIKQGMMQKLLTGEIRLV